MKQSMKLKLKKGLQYGRTNINKAITVVKKGKKDRK